MGIEDTAAKLDTANKQRRLLSLPQVDFNAYLQAIEADKAAVKSASQFLEQVHQFFNGDSKLTGLSLPWSKTHDTIAIRPGEVSCWHGYNGHGKSQLLGQVIMHLAKQGQKCCILSFEMDPYKTLARMTRQALGAKKPMPEFIEKFIDWSEGKIWLYDQQGTVSQERVIAVIHYAARELGVNQFVVDSLMKCGIGSDDYSGQKFFVDKLCSAARDTQSHIHLVAHSRKGADEMQLPGKFDIAGSSDISNQVDNVFGVFRNKRKENAKEKDHNEHDALLICDKQRNGEWEGKVRLWFHPESFRYLSVDGEKVWPIL